MDFVVKFNEIKGLDDLREKMNENLMIKISNMRWVDVNGNEVDEKEYQYYNIDSHSEMDIEHIIDYYNNFRRVDLMVEQIDERGLDLFETLDEMIEDYFTWTIDKSIITLKSYDFKLFSYC